jgi:hypothetical protein
MAVLPAYLQSECLKTMTFLADPQSCAPGDAAVDEEVLRVHANDEPQKIRRKK